MKDGVVVRGCWVGVDWSEFRADAGLVVLCFGCQDREYGLFVCDLMSVHR